MKTDIKNKEDVLKIGNNKTNIEAVIKVSFDEKGRVIIESKNHWASFLSVVSPEHKLSMLNCIKRELQAQLLTIALRIDEFDGAEWVRLAEDDRT
jgi:hypothetical protein